jgi:hypothetical protein
MYLMVLHAIHIFTSDEKEVRGRRNDHQYEGLLRIYCISSRGQPTRTDPPAWGLGEMVTTPRRKKVSCYEIFIQKASDPD